MLDADTRRGRCEVTYQPKTTAEQLALLGQWKAWARNNVSDAVATVLDDLASAKARIAELEAMVRELLNNWFISGEAREKAFALLNQEERKP